ncbi:4-alpha-glucanotransferase [Mycobacterium intermedium]|uniref:4-alpha-glucanotransferase n=1 Tax=Mycobacterium intermedium TaxID=28445 RepID=A0A1E3SAY3_MYCIE|nr:4-alpha-glucanotransferase [Mycobacterium intermedium]MCV6967500.1 4-alpha-glucanotransferase [Mycobacterium intermedium]ODQ99293.1 4-alpha-glucanotransferase [Mycobacterium intermedium]OPE49133.1 4-alpha-glucanotransferase [Mycobacterium intermedium]ORB07749.1 4-alpha-glucanotransferase [Mycobacterium intermedium]
MAHPKPIPDDLRRLAAAHRVATSYRNERREPVEVDADVVIRVLGLLDVDAGTEQDRRRELARLAERDSAGLLPPTVAVRVDGRPQPLPGATLLVHEEGARTEVPDEFPAGLPPGWYRLYTRDGQEVTLVAAPPQVPAPPDTWGWMLQLYALRSARSWGIGDLGDLREFLQWTAADHGAGAVLLNPLHAPGPTHPVQPSPYTPSSRRFANPLALRIEDLGAYRRADPVTRAEVDALRVSACTPRIDHDLVWAAKRAALELLWRAEGRPAPLDHSDGLRDWATYCALAERHGGRWTRWPEPLRDVAGPAVAAVRRELAPRLAFHAWVQQRCAEQLAAVRDAAREAGMALGVVHDLAVGVDPEGADAWALADVLATGVSVGAPPDNFTPRGQDWGLPPWRPDRLAATGYAALRDMLRAVLAHADGLRIDHVAGLWRLWWIPPGEGPDRGTYVYYDTEVLLAVLALEAHRAKATVVGEDLGTVEPEVTDGLADRGMLGCAVSWFTRDQSVPDEPLLPSAKWPSRAAASLSTHDLPTAAGFLRGEHVRVRADLDLLDDVPAEWATADKERAEWLTLLRSEGLLPEDGSEPDEASIIVAMHRFLASTPSRLKLIAPYDVIAEPRQPNLPGTIDEYPNWRLPLPETLEELRNDPRVAEIAALFSRPAS